MGVKSTHGVGQSVRIKIKEGATVLGESEKTTDVSPSWTPHCVIASFVPSAGAHTYKVAINQTGTGTATVNAAATTPSFILVELI